MSKQNVPCAVHVDRLLCKTGGRLCVSMTKSECLSVLVQQGYKFHSPQVPFSSGIYSTLRFTPWPVDGSLACIWCPTDNSYEKDKKSSLGTRPVCDLMVYLLWQVSLANLRCKQISFQHKKCWVNHNRLSDIRQVYTNMAVRSPLKHYHKQPRWRFVAVSQIAHIQPITAGDYVQFDFSCIQSHLTGQSCCSSMSLPLIFPVTATQP